MKLVSICGSPGPTSANRAALTHAIDHLVRSDLELQVADASLADIPVFDPRLADEPPPSVVGLSDQLVESDGVMIAAPEYAGGLAGGTKTALDWLVGLASLYHRPVVVLSAGTTGGEFAIEQLVRTLSWQGALVMATLGIESPKTRIDDAGRIVDTDLATSIEAWADQLVTAISADPAARKQRLSEVVTPFGIDVERFGDLA